MVSISAVQPYDEAAGVRAVWPFVSIIVPTRNRAAYLRDVLGALSNQVYPVGRMEIIVIDNSSTDETEDVVRQAAVTGPFPVRYLRKQDDGPASSRNRGAEMATGEILAFTDSDCVPAPGWVRAAVARFDPGVALVCGPILPVWDGPDPAFFMHQIYEVMHEDGLYATANVFYRREAFLARGGFDERFRTYAWGQPVGGDDTDLAWRVRRAGGMSTFAKDAVVYHQASPISARAYLLQPLAAQIIPQLVARIPELRTTSLYKRYFLHRQSATFCLAVAGIVGARRTRTSLVLTLPWLQATWPAVKRDIWPPRRWGRAGLRFALQAQSSALLSITLIQSSIRNRSVVL
ncbi:MAG: glycosyltransferase [Chloroflexi bacterium]|nr:glycosyltransferase [Chloroflexota bacterium]